MLYQFNKAFYNTIFGFRKKTSCAKLFSMVRVCEQNRTVLYCIYKEIEVKMIMFYYTNQSKNREVQNYVVAGLGKNLIVM